MLSREETTTRYIGFLQGVLGASNRKDNVVPDKLHKTHRVSTYAYNALKELGYITVKDDVERGPQVPIWQLEEHPEEKHAHEVIEMASKLHEECTLRNKHRKEQQHIEKILGEHMVTITVNGATLHVPLINDTLVFEVDGDKIEIQLES